MATHTHAPILLSPWLPTPTHPYSSHHGHPHPHTHTPLTMTIHLSTPPHLCLPAPHTSPHGQQPVHPFHTHQTPDTSYTPLPPHHSTPPTPASQQPTFSRTKSYILMVESREAEVRPTSGTHFTCERGGAGAVRIGGRVGQVCMRSKCMSVYVCGGGAGGVCVCVWGARRGIRDD